MTKKYEVASSVLFQAIKWISKNGWHWRNLKHFGQGFILNFPSMHWFMKTPGVFIVQRISCRYNAGRNELLTNGYRWNIAICVFVTSGLTLLLICIAFVSLHKLLYITGADNVHLKILVPSIAAGAIIGKGGETIAAVQKEAGARVKMSKANDFYPGKKWMECFSNNTLLYFTTSVAMCFHTDHEMVFLTIMNSSHFLKL